MELNGSSFSPCAAVPRWPADRPTRGSELKPLLIVPQCINGNKKSDGRQMKPLTSQEIRLSVTLLAYSAAPLRSSPRALFFNDASRCRDTMQRRWRSLLFLWAEQTLKHTGPKQAGRRSGSPLFCWWDQKRTSEMMFSASEDQKLIIYKK